MEIRYIAKDGSEFKNLNEAIQHEKLYLEKLLEKRLVLEKRISFLKTTAFKWIEENIKSPLPLATANLYYIRYKVGEENVDIIKETVHEAKRLKLSKSDLTALTRTVLKLIRAKLIRELKYSKKEIANISQDIKDINISISKYL